MANEPPKITIYARVLDGMYDSQIEPFVNIKDKNGNFDFGRISMFSGGESQRIVEFDIWNNEPAFSAGGLALNNADATNCRFTVWDDTFCKTDATLLDKIATPDLNFPNRPVYFVKARGVIDTDYTNKFASIGGIYGVPNEQIIGNVSRLPKTLSGVVGGDHVKIQTKIGVTANNAPKRSNFVFAFHYNFE